jgi:DNA-binding PadR family transcriptional regulator
MHDLTGFQRDCLVVIAGLDAPKGLEIKEDLDDYYASEVNHGRLYPNLDTLVNEGLVEKGKLDDRTNSYTLTDEGAEVLAVRREWEDQYADL